MFDKVKYGLFLVAVVFISSCVQTRSENERLSAAPENQDSRPRVVSLAPSCTEMITFLSDSINLVGVTNQCDYPVEVKDLPKLVIYPSIDLETLVKLKPDLVVYHHGISTIDDLQKIEGMGIELFEVHAQNWGDVITSMRDLGDKLNLGKKASDKCEMLFLKLDKYCISKIEEKKTLALVSSDPAYGYGHGSYFDGLMRCAGFNNALDGVLQGEYPLLDRESLLAMNPDKLIVGEGLDTSVLFNTYPEVKMTAAYLNKRIYRMNHNLMSRPGPRVVDAVEKLKQIANE